MAKTFWDGLRNYFRNGWSLDSIDYSSRRQQRKLKKGKLQGDVSGFGDIFDRYGMLGANSDGYRTSKSIGNGGAFSNTQLAEMQYNHDEAQIDRDWNERMYQQYQSPEAMMRQYDDAGLNSALMYGGVDINGPSGGSAASVSGADGGEDPQSGFERVMGVMSQFLNMITGASSIGATVKDISNRSKATDSEIALQTAEINKKKVETEGITIDNERKQLQFTIEQAVKAAVISQKQADASIAEWNAAVLAGTPVDEATNNILTKYKIDAQNLSNLEQTGKNLVEEGNKITAETELIRGRNAREYDKNHADIRKINSEISLIDSEKSFTDVQSSVQEQVRKSAEVKAYYDQYAKDNALPLGDYTAIALFRSYQISYEITHKSEYLTMMKEIRRLLYQNMGKDVKLTWKDAAKFTTDVVGTAASVITKK